MKKVLVFIIALFYLSITSGVEVNWHYCMGKLASVAWGEDHQDRCSRCGMQDKDGCCETVTHFVKVDDAHQWVKFHWSSMLELSAHPIPTMVSQPVLWSNGSTPIVFEAPPPISGRSRLSLLQVFRI